ncbi:MAG: aldo/keto reductase [Calditrichaeota bacterium]|nr:aldo/keto reductase [Calditrichota bacterium]
MSLPGYATTAATRAHQQRLATEWAPDAFRRLGRTELWVSKVGVGTFHYHLESEANRQALEKALQQGINLIDTAAIYGGGTAESLIGEVLTRQVVWEGLSREQVVVMSKVGYVQGEIREQALERERQKRPFKDLLKYTPDLWYCLHPRFLEDQIPRTLARLHLDTLDVYLLHSPEYFFLGTQGDSPQQLAEHRKAFYQRLHDAFLALEKMVQDNLIRYYGISSNGLVNDPQSYNFIDLGEVWRVYEQVCLERHITPEEGHFAVIEFPLNVIEHRAVTEAAHTFQGRRYPLLELARRLDLGVVVNRPLHAIWGQMMIRLADYDHPELARLQEQVRHFLTNFREIETHLLQLLEKVYPRSRSQEKDEMREVFSLSASLEVLANEVTNPLAVVQQIQQVYLPRIQEATRRLFLSAGPRQVNKLRDYLDAYLAHLQKLMPAIVKYLTARNRDRVAPLNELFGQHVPDAQPLNMAEKALLFAASAPGVAAALNSMNRPEYVDHAIRVLKHRMDIPREMFAEIQNLFPLSTH